MKKIYETYFDVVQPDGCGEREEVYCSCTSEKVANDIAMKHCKSWPKTVRKRILSLYLIESEGELVTKQMYDKVRYKKFEDLTDEELKIALKYRGVVN